MQNTQNGHFKEAVTPKEERKSVSLSVRMYIFSSCYELLPLLDVGERMCVYWFTNIGESGMNPVTSSP